MFLSNAHFRYLEDEVKQSLNSKDYSKIFIRTESLPDYFSKDNKVIQLKENKVLPNLLSFNRLLLALIARYESLDIVVTGINFYLSKNPYNSSYIYAGSLASKKLFNKKLRKRKKNDIIQNMINHDIIFNFVFSKIIDEFKIKINTESQLSEILKLSVEEFLQRA